MKPTIEMIGKITHDITNVYLDQNYCTFMLACTSYHRNKEGTKEESIDYVPCIARGSDKIKAFTTYGKGKLLIIIGKLHTYGSFPTNSTKEQKFQQWKKFGGQLHPKFFVNVSSFKLLKEKPTKENNHA